jgi:phospholipase/lecithinase/hemolysin
MGLGAKTIVVPGNFPIGCSPGYLAKFRANDTAQYDSRGCLKWANNLAALHNSALKAELARLSLQHPGVAVLYADYYAAAMALIADPRRHGFGGEPLVSCCGGGGGPYNVDFAAQCGAKRATACRDPSMAVSWDGFHYTDHAYKLIADAVLRETRSHHRH